MSNPYEPSSDTEKHVGEVSQRECLSLWKRFKRLIRHYDVSFEGVRDGEITNPIPLIRDLHIKAVGLKTDKQIPDNLISDDEIKRGADLALYSHDINEELSPDERKAIERGESLNILKDPKEQILTFLVCILSSFTQGWNQSANGNLGWPSAFGLTVNYANPTSLDTWKFGAANALPWFMAAIGALLSDVLQHELFGRRYATMIAAISSLVGSIWASQASSWESFMGAKVFLGIGLGAKASVVPVWEAEFLPPGKRGPFLTSWQVFTALGIFAGSIITYIFRDDWRKQVISGAVPALVLVIVIFTAVESPRWLMVRDVRDHFRKAMSVLQRLRGNRVVAAREFISIHYSIQAERLLFPPHSKNVVKLEDALEHERKRVRWHKRIVYLLLIPRYRHAMIASGIVMLSQQMSGINILAFLYSTFFTRADGITREGDIDPLKLGIAFGTVNFVFSTVGFFFVDKNRFRVFGRARGRRFLLLFSLVGGAVTLMAAAITFGLNESDGGMVAWLLIFTMVYSPGAGCIPFLYSAEIWGNEMKELGFSFAVFLNFFGAGIIALCTPLGINWGHEKLLGLFSGLNLVAAILVYFFVPAFDRAASIEQFNWLFKQPLGGFAKEKLFRLWPF